MISSLEDKFLEWWTNAWNIVWPSGKNFAPWYVAGRTIFRVAIYGSLGIIVFSLLGIKQKVDKLFKWAQR
jgi:hypothetical protein